MLYEDQPEGSVSALGEREREREREKVGYQFLVNHFFVWIQETPYKSSTP